MSLRSTRPFSEAWQRALRPPTLRMSCSACRWSSTSTGAALPASVLAKLREDLKTAMRAKDAPRLAVLRGVLADITNSSKTSTPIKDDLSLLSLLRKRADTSKKSISDFYEADRKDLVAKEEEQVRVLEEYAGSIKTLGEEDIREAISSIMESLRADSRKLALGDVLKRSIGPGGILEGKMVNRAEVTRIAKEMLDAA